MFSFHAHWLKMDQTPEINKPQYLTNPINSLPPNTQVQLPTPQPHQVIIPRQMLPLSLHHSPHSFLTLRHKTRQQLRSTTTTTLMVVPELMRDSGVGPICGITTFQIIIEAGAAVLRTEKKVGGGTVWVVSHW